MVKTNRVCGETANNILLSDLLCSTCLNKEKYVILFSTIYFSRSSIISMVNFNWQLISCTFTNHFLEIH